MNTIQMDLGITRVLRFIFKVHARDVPPGTSMAVSENKGSLSVTQERKTK